jgi:polyhydroxybutyrate depolymerase
LHTALAIALGAGAAAAETIEIGVAKRSYLTQFPRQNLRRWSSCFTAIDRRRHRDADLVVAGRQPGRFGVIYPDRLNHAWADLRPDSRRAGQAPPAGTDDVAFIAKLIEKYVADGFADPKHVYITGLSNGGAMTMTLACARADLFAAAASVIMNLTDESASGCHPSRPVPMLVMNGTAYP